MKLTKGKIILLIIVVYFAIFAVININKEKDTNKEILDKVVIVENGELKKENEGKIVVVSGKIGYDNLVSFMELDENFGTIKIKRTVEDYLKIKDKDGKNETKWVERTEPLEDNNGDYLKTIVSEEKISKVTIGDFELDEKGLSLIPAKKRYSGQEKIGDLITTGLDYSRDPYEEDLKVGDMRLIYEYYELDKDPELSILAVQKGNSFVPYKVDKKHEVYQVFVGKVDTKAKLEKELQTNVKQTTKGKFLFIIMIIGVGIFLIVDNKKK
ncbi:MAG: hypothetical protein IJ193_03235 [Bacilli bacterium]|nr:hypothetical protein [Bacilli bacterium]